MSLRPPRNSIPPLTTMAAAAGIIAACYVGRPVLIPLALAVLISFLLAPLVRRLERAGARRALAVGVVSVLAAAPLPLLGWIAALEFLELADEAPKYQARMEEKLRAVQGPLGRFIARADLALKELDTQAGVGPQAAEPVAGPVPVTLVGPSVSSMEIVRGIAGPLTRVIATAGVVLVFVVVILVQREDLRNRFIRLVSRGQIGVTTRALDELGDRLSRFLRMQFVVNFSYGVSIGLGLWLLGVPGAVFWGFACMALRYIPFLGAVVGAAMPIGLSLVISKGWALPLETASLFIGLELAINNIVEPWLYGSRTGVSVLAVLVAAVFWTWLWGLPGLFLSMPMTVCLVVAGRYVPQLAFLQVLLSDQPVLPPSARIYQRLLAMDADEALEVAETYLGSHTLAELYDNVLVEVLQMVGQDLAEENVDPTRGRLSLEALGELVDEVASPADRPRPSAQGPVPPSRTEFRALCIPAREEGDAIAARMLANILSHEGMTARALSVQDLGSDLSAILDELRPDVVVISAAPPRAVTRALLRFRLVRRRAPDEQVLVGVWGSASPEGHPAGQARLRAAGAAGVFAGLSAAASAIREVAAIPGAPLLPTLPASAV